MDDVVEGDAPLSWGGPRELTPFETMMWRADGDPMIDDPHAIAQTILRFVDGLTVK
jgi:hypothetical protein